MSERQAGVARYIMIGGFLGAGKTTAMAKFARYLSDRGHRVGLVTNDQGNDLVDTALLRSAGFATEEIPGGCFCCRFNSLMDAARRLGEAAHPDIFLAEPVGSCTDLVATVSYPLRRMYGDRFRIAPLTVLVDPIRARRVLGLELGGRFSEKVAYIYRKQLEEADLIAINKCDLVEAGTRAELRDALQREYPAAGILEISARENAGLEAWFERVLSAEQPSRMAMEIDYQVYGAGEALLGWLNATLDVKSPSGADAGDLLRRLAGEVQKRLRQQAVEIAHLKMTLSTPGPLGGIASIHVVRNDIIPELGHRLDEPVEAAQLILNLRAEGDPERLAAAVTESVAEVGAAIPGLSIEVEHLERFRPGQPQPTHREIL